MIYNIDPVAKPRMTQRDKWMKRPIVVKYHQFKDLCRLYNVKLEEQGCNILFNIAMPKSWSKATKAHMDGQPHRQKPDISNLLKALEDAVFKDDSKIWHYAGLKKLWAYEGSIEIKGGKE